MAVLFNYYSYSSTSRKCELNVLKKIWVIGEISNKLPNGLLETNVYKTLESCW